VKKTRSTISARQTFAANLRRERLALGWSQMDLADKADLHFTYVSSVECSKRNVSIDAMSRIARALGVPLSELLREDLAANSTES
jgi:transcriptional regulator with XRE-family HTH domain